MSLFAELKRRNVYRVGIAYLAGSWLLVEVSETLFPVYGISDAAVRLIVMLLAIGFPICLIFSWVFEWTPEGLKFEKNIDPSVSVTYHTGKKLDRIIIALLVLVLGYFAFDKFVLEPARDQSNVEIARQEGRTEALVGSYGAKSIAVLPFVNMSDDPGNEYFSKGISEELLNLLTKIPELRVTSRSSAFSFRDENLEVPEIARRLNVTYVLEGSVRKAGNQLRIAVQLIDARSDTHLWSETYDRTLDDIFTIQDEIATTIVTQLKITLLNDSHSIRKTDSKAYALYLQGRHLNRQNTVVGYEQAQALLQQALAIDPVYTAAWNELGPVYINQANRGLRSRDEGITLARKAINKALEIDPAYAPAHSNLGWNALTYYNDLPSAARHFERALQLEPGNISIIERAGALTAALGQLQEAISLNKFVVARDPVNPFSHSNMGLYYSYAGRWDEAIASYHTALTLSPSYAGAQFRIGVALLFKGETEAALAAMQSEDSLWQMIGLPLAYHALGQTNESDAALAALIEQYEQFASYNIAYILAWRGESNRAFLWLGKAVENKDGGLAKILGEHLFSNIHDDPRWLPFLESIGKSPDQLAAIEFSVTLPD